MKRNGKTNKQGKGGKSYTQNEKDTKFGAKSGKPDRRSNPKNGFNRGNQQNLQGSPYTEDDVRESRSNPPEYYTKFDQFAKDAANLPFAQPVGAVVNVSDSFNAASVVKSQFVVPGVARIGFYPTIGVSSNFTSPMNRSSIRFYTYLRSNQKASGAYDHQDLTMMQIAMDSCYMFHALMARVYATINLFTPTNYYYAQAITEACGFDYADIRANLQDFRAYINAFAYQLGQYALPDHMYLFDRHRWMCEGLYTDSESKKAQTYIFVPIGFYQYDNTVSTGSQCTMVNWLTLPTATNTLHTFAQAKAFGDALINAISNDEDFAIISGDIYNFYGGKTYSLPYIEENYMILPKYDKTVLSQIENAVIVPVTAAEVPSFNVTQNPSVNGGAIISNPRVRLPFAFTQNFMNFHWDRPTPEDVIEASRLIVTMDAASTATGGSIALSACATEVVSSVDIFTRTATGTTFNIVSSIKSSLYDMNKNNGATVTVAIKQLLALAQFDWAPGMRYYLATSDSSTEGTHELAGFSWDIDNFDNVPNNYIETIHTAALLSLFDAGISSDK